MASCKPDRNSKHWLHYASLGHELQEDNLLWPWPISGLWGCFALLDSSITVRVAGGLGQLRLLSCRYVLPQMYSTVLLVAVGLLTSMTAPLAPKAREVSGQS